MSENQAQMVSTTAVIWHLITTNKGDSKHFRNASEQGDIKSFVDAYRKKGIYSKDLLYFKEPFLVCCHHFRPGTLFPNELQKLRI